MVFFSLFVVGAVILGAGAMLSPAWPSDAPRIGLSATFILGLIAGGAVWWAELFGWDTLIIDYLLFGIVSLVILGGTLSRGGSDEAGWPSRKDLIFFALAALLCMIPLFMFSATMRDEVASDISFTQKVLENNSFESLAPSNFAYKNFPSPAFHALAAYLAHQLRQDVMTIHMALGSLFAFLCIWTVYDLGMEIRDKRLAWSMVAVLLISLGLLGLLWQGSYAALMAVLFDFAFITYALRFYREHHWVDMVAAGLMLGAVLWSESFLFVLTVLAYYLDLFVSSRNKNMKGKNRSRIVTPGIFLGIVGVSVLATLPWLLKNWPALILNDKEPSLLASIYVILFPLAGGYVLAELIKKLPLSRLNKGSL